MSKVIKITQENLAEIRSEFEKMLQESKLSNGEINFTRKLGNLQRKATLYFTELAWLKQSALVREFNDEVAWHGIAKRGKKPDTYIIEDILVYPQEVTGSTVTTDQEEYQSWLMNMEDEVFNNIRMQGHSHVNMGVTPSSVDTSLYDRVLDQLDDNMFYIFLIWNKRNDKTIKIYDLRENVLFETDDIKVEILETKNGIQRFIKNAKQTVRDKKPVVTSMCADFKKPDFRQEQTKRDYGRYSWEDYRDFLGYKKR